MIRKLQKLQPIRDKILLSALVVLTSIFSSFSYGQFVAPAIQDTTQFGKNVQRTMHLLATSTPSKRNTVKILVYGQSISKQRWWLDVKKNLQAKYPHADLIIENKSIGGFSSVDLRKPMVFDVLPFYPDLVLFHVYGSSVD